MLKGKSLEQAMECLNEKQAKHCERMSFLLNATKQDYSEKVKSELRKEIQEEQNLFFCLAYAKNVLRGYED